MNIQNFSRYDVFERPSHAGTSGDSLYIHPGKVKKIFQKNGNLYLFFDT